MMVVNINLHIQDAISWLERYQDLVGAALGALFAILLTFCYDRYKSSQEEESKHRETLRKIEISTARCLNEVATLRQEINSILDNIVDASIKIKSEKAFFNIELPHLNYPLTSSISWDYGLSLERSKSYYLHNVLLEIDYNMRSLNKVIDMSISDFAFINNIYHSKCASLGRGNADQQQAINLQYSNNLKSFAARMRNFTNERLPLFLRKLCRVNRYNDLLRQDFEQTVRQYEKELVTSLSMDIKESVSHVDHMKEIDKILDEMVHDEYAAILNAERINANV